ncbi:hypothetical protein SAURM35S_03071 [Streptomyces aurantiogriseus]
MTRSGSAAANGIAPSLMKEAPSTQAALPFSRSAVVNSFLRRVVASAMPSGGTMPAAMTAAMTFMAESLGSATVMPAVAKVYATLLTGPPRSKHIIRPSRTPSTMALVPDSPSSQSVMASWASAMGLPMTTNIRNPTTIEEIRGITTTGMMPRRAAGMSMRWIARTTPPAIRPAARPPRKPAPMVDAIMPPTKPGTRPGRSAMPYAM